MSTLREAAQQALEALSLALSDVEWRINSPTQRVIHGAYNNLRAALALEQAAPQQSMPIRATVFDDAHPNGIPLEQWVRSGSPPQRQPLSGLEVECLLEQVIGSLPVARNLVRAVERAHGITE